ncbi:MAG: thiamine-phosphate kinase [Actinomycetales bacterium]|nr:thiamine-phosphate kinase [Actinomycetales bacterium]
MGEPAAPDPQPHRGAGAPAGAGPTLAELGEGAALARIIPRLGVADAAIVGPGDDAAVLAAPDARVVVTTDTMAHGPDFRLAWSTPFELGWKAAATNLADIAAMGARPTGLVVALLAPAETPVSLLEGLADGLKACCDALAPGCTVVGGDLSTSSVLTIAVTAFGDLEGRDPVLRSGARPGDVVAVSGPLGLAGEGLRLLFAEGVDATGAPSTDRAAALRASHPAELAAQLTPRPPIADGPRAAEAGARAMMDVSDGLALDAGRLARASGVGLDLSGSAVAAAVDGLPAAPLGAALAGGEDHALLAAFPPGTELPGGFRAVGVVVEAGPEGPEVRVDGSRIEGRGGWDASADWDGGAG